MRKNKMWDVPKRKKYPILSVKGLKIGGQFVSGGVLFEVTSFPTRYTVCGKNIDVSLNAPNAVKEAISKIQIL